MTKNLLRQGPRSWDKKANKGIVGTNERNLGGRCVQSQKKGAIVGERPSQA